MVGSLEYQEPLACVSAVRFKARGRTGGKDFESKQRKSKTRYPNICNHFIVTQLLIN